MPKKISDTAMAKVPSLANLISLFTSKLQISHYAAGSITDYCHALYKAVCYLGKLPEEFTQEEVDGYLKFLLNRTPLPAEAQFKHFIYGLKCYLKAMGYPELAGLALPKILRGKTLPRILSVESVRLLLQSCGLYSKTLFAVIYDCGLRAFETCNLRWNDIDFNRGQVHVRLGKGRKDRIVPISDKTLQVLEYIGRYAYRVAISNSRIKDISARDIVTYDYKDYKQAGVHKLISMHAVDFLHLFSLDVLPFAFVRIRHYGILSPSNRDKVRKVQEQLGAPVIPKQRKKKPYLHICQERGWNIGKCPCCGVSTLIIEVIRPRLPPTSISGTTHSK